MADFFSHAGTVGLSREEESSLVARVRAGDQAACARLVEVFSPQMMSVARRFLRCDANRDDALQDAFISAFKALGDFEANSRLSTWLHRIMVNACLTKIRDDSLRREISLQDLDRASDESPNRGWRFHAIDDPSANSEHFERRAVVRRAINQLPEVDRAVLLSRDILGLDTAATAARLGTSEHNVKRRLRRARRALFERLEPLVTTRPVYELDGRSDSSANRSRRP